MRGSPLLRPNVLAPRSWEHKNKGPRFPPRTLLRDSEPDSLKTWFLPVARLHSLESAPGRFKPDLSSSVDTVSREVSQHPLLHRALLSRFRRATPYWVCRALAGRALTSRASRAFPIIAEHALQSHVPSRNCIVRENG